MTGLLEPCACCGKPLEANVLAGNICRECFDHYPRPHPEASNGP